MDPSASKTRRIALSLVLSAANVVVVVFDRSQHRRPDSVSAGPRTHRVCGRNARAGLAECCRLTARNAP
jgi:hypothetical protein